MCFFSLNWTRGGREKALKKLEKKNCNFTDFWCHETSYLSVFDSLKIFMNECSFSKNSLFIFFMICYSLSKLFPKIMLLQNFFFKKNTITYYHVIRSLNTYTSIIKTAESIKNSVMNEC